MKLNYKILKDLCNIYSPSGYEDNMIKYIVDNVKTNPNFAYITTKKKSVIVYNKIYIYLLFIAEILYLSL